MLGRVLSIAITAVVVSGIASSQNKAAPDPQELRAQRAHLMRFLKAANSIVNAHSYAEKVRIVCYSQLPATPILSDATVEELELRYAELLRNEPPTREQELNRQYALQASREVLTAAHQNEQQCITAHVTGLQTIPTDDEELFLAAKLLSSIADIDKKLESYR